MTRARSTDQLCLLDPIGWEMGAVERWAASEGYDLVVGVDEAGRGPLAGPVVAAACVLDLERARSAGWLERVNDSKQLDGATREALFDRIRATSVACAVAQVEARDIDRINIHQATLLAMRQSIAAVASLAERGRRLVAIDGKQRVRGIQPTLTVVKGDSRSHHIAAASILAKVSRDRIMAYYHRIWPDYGFSVHKGYPTPAHRDCLTRHGPTPIHRLSFAMDSASPCPPA